MAATQAVADQPPHFHCKSDKLQSVESAAAQAHLLVCGLHAAHEVQQRRQADGAGVRRPLRPDPGRALLAGQSHRGASTRIAAWTSQGNG